MTFEINGKQVGIKFNMYAVEQMRNVKGGFNGSFAFITTIVWAGYLGYCYAKQIDPELSFEDMTEFVDQSIDNKAVKATIELIAKEYTESKMYEKLIEQQPKEEKKSKVKK